MTRHVLLPLLLTACARSTAPDPTPLLPTSPTACVAGLTEALADDGLQGRGLGTEGLARAADLIEARMRGLGLDDAGIGHRQPFDAVVGVELGPTNALSWPGGVATLGTDTTPMAWSSDGSFTGEVVFAGFGITAAELGYDDYEGLDVAGKVVLAMRFEPGEDDPESAFDGRRPSRWSDLRSKATRARDLGAAALVLVTPAAADGEPDPLPPLRAEGPESRAGLPVLHVTRAVADAWLASAGTDLAALRAAIDATGAPASRPVPVEVSGTIEVVARTTTVHNVVGVLPGRGAAADEVVVVGAHYDHLGLGGRGSMTPDVQAIHNGADDNASGVATMLCALQDLADDDADRRTVVAVAFTAEEVGLGGSSWYVQHPVLPLDRTVAMVNLDMVGHLWAGPLQALGTDSAPEWRQLLEPAAEAAGLQLTTGGDGYGPSDHMSFFTRDIPVVHLFTGAHERYHTPADDPDTLDVPGMVAVTGFLTRTLSALADPGVGLTFTPSTAGPMMAGDSRGFGSYLGTIPDYSAMSSTEGGVLLSGVRAGGPADLAGLARGDVLTGLGGHRIDNLYDFTFALRDHRPGDTVEVIVQRDGASRTLQATLGSRGAPSGGHGGGDWSPRAGIDASHLLSAEEVHLTDLRQLTFGGENAEAYWSPDGRSLIFQRTPADGSCDQQFVLDLDTGSTTRVSSGLGRTTCGYYTWPDGRELLYATTEGASPACPPPPDRSAGYVWPLYEGYDLVRHRLGEPPRTFASVPGAYDAEATVCMVDGRVVFTSTRDGDLDLYVTDPLGAEVTRLTDTPGYDGGAFFTPDCSAIVYRASRPAGDALADYQRLLGEGLVRPGQLELFRMAPDGSDVVQLTDNGAANFGPYPFPDNSAVIFSSNVGGSGREFDLWAVPWAGGEPERVTFTDGFDGFPMFSPDGRHLVFASNRATAEGRSDTNLFVARWVATPSDQ